MHHVIKKIAVLPLFVLGLFAAVPSSADMIIEQDCRSVKKFESSLTPTGETTTEYLRRIFIKKGLFVIELVVNDIPTREYGFDFDNKIYYEADLVNNDYRKYLFSRINEDYAKAKTGNLMPTHGMGRAAAILKKPDFSDYKIRSGRSVFRKKRIGDFDCVLYGYKIGPGFSRLQPLSWGKDIKAWVTKDIPGYAEYEAVAAGLKSEAEFYRKKQDEISDFIIVLQESDGFPVEIRKTSKQDFGVGRLYGRDDEIAVRFISRKIENSEISYYNNDFTLNPIGKRPISPPAGQFPPGDAAWGRGAEGMDLSKANKVTPVSMLYAILIPVVFILGLIFYSYKNMTKRKAALADPNARVCPHCKAVIEKIYVVCPRCNKNINS